MCNIQKARIAYAGPALTDGEMDVRELAPALIAFAEFVSNAGKAIGCERNIKVMLNQDSLNKGSFDITFILNMGILEQARLFMEGSKATGLDDLMAILGYVANTGGTAVVVKSIFDLISTIGKKTMTKITKKSPDTSEIHLADGTKIEVNINTLKVFLDVGCRKSIEGVIRPLETAGIDSFEVRNPADKTDKKPVAAVKKSEAELFKAPPAKEITEELPEAQSQEMLVKLVTINFEQGKWKVTDGTNPAIWVTIADEAFLNQISNHEITFGSGDMLRIAYRHVQKLKNGVLSSEYIVDKVLEVRPAPKQIKLDFEYEE